MATTATNCIYGTEYVGHDVGSGYSHILQSDFKSCQSFCISTYPTATHFTYHTSDSGWVGGRLTCWCKSSNVSQVGSGRVSGEVNCEGNLFCVIQAILGYCEKFVVVKVIFNIILNDVILCQSVKVTILPIITTNIQDSL